MFTTKCMTGSSADADCSSDEMAVPVAPAVKYRKSSGWQPPGFMFPNDETRSRICLDAAFNLHGLEIADVHTRCYMWTWVLTTDGNLWLHDKSHGGGGYFCLERKN